MLKLCVIVINASFVQVKKMIQHIRQYQVPLQKYMAMMDLQVWPSVQLFHLLFSQNVTISNSLRKCSEKMHSSAKDFLFPVCCFSQQLFEQWQKFLSS